MMIRCYDDPDVEMCENLWEQVRARVPWYSSTTNEVFACASCKQKGINAKQCRFDELHDMEDLRVRFFFLQQSGRVHIW